jgi:hypothetical protein
VGYRPGYKRPNPERDKALQRVRDMRKRAEMRRWFIDYKATQHCELCGESHPATLDFHHVDPGTKVAEVSVMVSKVPRYSKALILVEIGKCRVLCANCHRKEHWNEAPKSRQSSLLQPQARPVTLLAEAGVGGTPSDRGPGTRCQADR